MTIPLPQFWHNKIGLFIPFDELPIKVCARSIIGMAPLSKPTQ